MNLLPITAHLPGPGTLALVGSGEYLPPIEALDRLLLARLAEPAQVVCLPTAAGTEGEERIRYWSELGVKHFTRLGVERVEALPVTDRVSASDEALAERVRQANFVYLSGGKPHYLYMSLENTPVFQAIEAVLTKGGVVAGCSAGAMIFGQDIPGSPFPWSWQPGFGYLPGAIVLPHFEELPKAILSGFLPFTGKLTIIGVEGNTALVCTQEGCYAAGSGGVTLIHGNEKVRYLAEE